MRLSPPGKWEKAQSAFAVQEKAFQLGLPVSEPIELAQEEGQVRFVERWLSGQMAKDALPALPQEEQYRLGREAGEILRALHTIPAPAETEDWESRFNRKIERKIQLYRECPFQYENGEAFIRYMEETRGLLRGRPQCMQHGDYHTGNMMLCGGKLFVIDFDRFDWGDPWEEFNRIVWSAQLSPAFARARWTATLTGRRLWPSGSCWPCTFPATPWGPCPGPSPMGRERSALPNSRPQRCWAGMTT